MYDELIKDLRGMAKGFCPFDIGNKMCGGYFVTQEAADAIERLDAIAQTYMETVHEIEDKRKWIPVTERLPENDVPVLLSCKCGVGTYICDGFHTEKYSVPMPFYADIDADYDEETDEYYFPEGWWEIIKNWDDYSCVAIEDTITHWMPLPQPPKDGET